MIIIIKRRIDMAQGFPKIGLFRGKDLSLPIVLIVAAAIIIIAAVYWYQTKNDDDDSEKVYKVDLVALNDTHTVYPGRENQFAVIVHNLGNVSDEIELAVRSPEEIGAFFEEGVVDDDDNFIFGQNIAHLKAGRSCAIILNTLVLNASQESGKMSINVVATSTGNRLKSANIWLSLYIEEVEDDTIPVDHNDKVQVDYTGFRLSGEVFDTSVESIAKDGNLERNDNVKSKTSFLPLKVYLGETDPDTEDDYIQVIEGFWQGTLHMMVGETKVVRLDPVRAYGVEENENNELAGKWLLFEITLLSIDDRVE